METYTNSNYLTKGIISDLNCKSTTVVYIFMEIIKRVIFLNLNL